MASYDALTGLPNRALFNDRIAQLIAFTMRRNTTFALLFIDLDHFKEVNDTLGHQIGDELLVMIAQRLQAAVRAEDTVARMGGDEFVILLDNPSSREQIVNIAEKLLDNLRSPIQWAGQEFQVGYSVGISQYPANGTNASSLMASADKAMYETKAAGRNGYRFSPGTTKPGVLS
jgi:diguanylate cyclase (GGDEF)-like protein